MTDFLDAIHREEAYLSKLERKIDRDLATTPEGCLRIKMKNRKYPQYYWVQEETAAQYPEGRYLKKEERALAGDLAQKHYDERLKDEITRRLAVLKKVNDLFIHPLEEVYRNLSEPRQQLVHPFVLSEEEYISLFYQNTPGNRNRMEMLKAYETDRGEIVRSKSEKIIADKLNYYDIPYVYEAELRMKNGGVIYPDFTILDTHYRKVYYWEHFGMMDSESYSVKTMLKIQEYEKLDIWPGERLLFTMETGEHPLNTKTMDRMIAHFFVHR